MIDAGMHYLKVITKVDGNVYFMVSHFGDMLGVELTRKQATELRSTLDAILSNEGMEVKAKWLDESSQS